MNRRDFLTASAAVGGLLALEASTQAATTLRRPGWKTAVGLNGFQSGTRKYKKDFPIWEVTDFAQRQNFDGVELVADWPQGAYPASTQAERIRALRSFYDAYGLKIFSIQIGADGAFDPDEEKRAAWAKMVEDRIRFAKQAGCVCVGMWPGGGLRGQTIEQAIERLAASFRRVAGFADLHGLLTAFEIEPPFVFNTEQHLTRILEAANHPNLKTIYDPSHFDLMNGSKGVPHEMLLRIGVKNIGYVHLTDTDGTLRDGGTSKHLACGEGHANIPESLKTLREGGFKGWVMIDSWEVPDPYDACAKGMTAIKEAWKK